MLSDSRDVSLILQNLPALSQDKNIYLQFILVMLI